MNTLALVKLFSLFSVLILSFFSSVLPWFLSRWLDAAEIWISYGNTLSGGVILGAGLMHMLPDTQTYFKEYEYPWATLIASFSVLLLFSIEQVFVSQHNIDEDLLLSHDHGKAKKQHATSNSQEPLLSNTQDFSCNEQIHEEKLSQEEEEEDQYDNSSTDITQEPDKFLEAEYEREIKSKKAILSAYSLLVALSVHSLFEGLGVGSSTSKASLITTMGALFSHKALEAFALGVGFYRFCQQKASCHSSSEQNYSGGTHYDYPTNNNNTETEFGYEKTPPLMDAQSHKKHMWHSWFILALYSMVTPLGIGIGLVVNAKLSSDVETDTVNLNSSETTNGTAPSNGFLVSGVMTGLATGSFLFVAFFEMLPAEFNGKRTKSKLALVFLGWIAMAILAILI